VVAAAEILERASRATRSASSHSALLEYSQGTIVSLLEFRRPALLKTSLMSLRVVIIIRFRSAVYLRPRLSDAFYIAGDFVRARPQGRRAVGGGRQLLRRPVRTLVILLFECAFLTLLLTI